MKKLLALLLCLGIVGCAESTAFEKAPDKYVANFTYAPASQGAPGSAGVTFAVGALSYKADPKVPWFTYPQFENFGKAMQEDLSKILAAKGFGVRGPFDSYDLMPYSDKKAVDLWVAPTMDLSLTFKDCKTEMESAWTSPSVGINTGNVAVEGKFTLELREIVTRELMWSKTIPLTKFEVPYSIRTPYYAACDFKPFVMNDVVKGVEQQYPDLMGTISKLIDPEEMQIIKKQCQELKNKKGH